MDGSDEEDPDAQRIIRESVDGKALAVDLSLWILQACTQPALDEVFNEDLGFDDPVASKTAKIVFDRALNYLRHGCVPVGVIDGQAPWEKLGALRARWGAQCTGGGGGAFGRCSDVALTVLRALGLPGVEAPGEAEATCAAMDRLDIVDGCVTSDGDSLLFGARTVFKTLKLSAANQKDLAMERVDAADLATRLTLGDKVEHVAPALTALALLTGGDYDLQGARNVGGTKALLVVRALAKSEAVRRRLAGKAGVPRRDRTLPERLDDFLASAPDPSIASLDKCTGCARCKHDGCRKGKVKAHGARGCTVCGTETGCVERTGECECPFHAREDERWLHKVRERANATDGYTRSFRDAARGYTQQAIDAEYALEDAEDVEFVGVGADGAGIPRKMKWRHRPDVEQLQDLMETYCGWEPRVTRQKLLPLLVEWDMRAAARALRKENESAVTPERRWELLAPKGVEFIVERIAKESGNNKAPPWRYLLEVNSADPAHWAQWQRQVQRVANELGGAGVGLGDEYLGRALPPHFHERGDDLAFLKAQAQRRSVRMSLVRKTCPHLVARFEAGGSNGASKSAPVTPAKAKPKSAANTPRGRTPKSVRGRPPPRSPDQHDITSFFSNRKPRAAVPIADAGLASPPPAAPTPASVARTPIPHTPVSKRKLSFSGKSENREGSHDSASDDSLLAAGLDPDPAAMKRIDARKKLAFADEGLSSPARPVRLAEVVDLCTPPTAPLIITIPKPGPVSVTKQPGAAPSSPAPRSPMFSPTKKARQATLFECLSPKPSQPEPETVDLCTPQK